MLDYVGAAFLAISVIALLKVLGVIDRAQGAVETSRESFAVLASATASDDEKERAARASAGRLFSAFLAIAARSIAALAAPTLVLWALDRMGVMSLEGALRATVSWPFLLGLVVVAVATPFALKAIRR
jgi:hypothetical protein